MESNLSLTESVSSGVSQVNAVLLDSLLNEIVEYFLSLQLSLPTTTTTAASTTKPTTAAAAAAPVASPGTREKDSEEALDAVFYGIESVGFKVGVRLSELHAIDKKRFVEPLDCVKFICKDMWSLFFKKNIDNLKTNHRGVFVLQDNSFRWFQHLASSSSSSSIPPSPEQLKRAKLYMAFSVGIIRGCMFNFGFPSTVSVENYLAPPSCSFQIISTSSPTPAPSASK